MNPDLDPLITSQLELLGLGEATHLDPGLGFVRNELIVDLVERHGFRSIALETDRVAAQLVDAYIRNGIGTLAGVLSAGFSHQAMAQSEPNRYLVGWLHDHNAGRPPEEQVAWHGFDVAWETFTVPSPRRFLQPATDYLGSPDGLDSLLGEDEPWESSEALLDPSRSIGDSPVAARLRDLTEDLIITLHARAPQLIMNTSLATWRSIKLGLIAARQVLHYHRVAAQPGPDEPRWNRLCAIRDAMMADHLLDIRRLEDRRGPTLVWAHNLHLQRNRSVMEMGPMHLEWFGAGAIVAAQLGDRYAHLAGSLGSSDALGLGAAEPGTYEALLTDRVPEHWSLVTDLDPAIGRERTDQTPAQGYFPLTIESIASADAVLHLPGGSSSPT